MRTNGTNLDLTAGLTIGAARRVLARALREHGIDTPDLDVRLIIGHALGLEHAELAMQADHVLARAQIDTITALAARRLAHEPVARILGRKEFWGLELCITDAVLVPRPDTETVVAAALAAIGKPATRPLRIADLGIGSGALLLALLSELPNATGTGTDRDPRAIVVARDNAERLGLSARANFVVCNYGAALAGQWHLVVSNPPYVPTGDIATLAPEVSQFDPHIALDGGSDGLNAYRAIAADAKRLLAPGGLLVVEIGIGQADAVAKLFGAAGLTAEQPARADLAGVPRAVCAAHNP